MVGRAGWGMIFTIALGLAAPSARADAAPDSVEAQLRAQGKHWVRSRGEITLGAYVEDLMKGRLDQPSRRGDIGRVVSLGFGENGRPDALVDFGRSYSVGIHLSELALVKLDRGGPVAASDGAAPDSVEGQLRAQGKGWVPSEGEITLGAYVKDMLVGRANQPAGRGDIGRVVALALGANGRPHVRVDFGRGYSVGIPLSQLSLVEVVLLQGGGF